MFLVVMLKLDFTHFDQSKQTAIIVESQEKQI